MSRRENKNSHFMLSTISPKIVPLVRYCGKILKSLTSHRRHYGACALHAGYFWPQTHSQNL